MAKTDYMGIDYSSGQSNVDLKTGIHYGVIPANVVDQAWWEDSEGEWGNPTCPACGDETIQYKILHSKRSYHVCEDCKIVFEDEDDLYGENPKAFTYNKDGYEMVQCADDRDIFILLSPYYTYCQYCSPCAPGAGYVTSWMDEGQGIKAYCLASDWFEDGKAPYPVYRVEDGSLVE